MSLEEKFSSIKLVDEGACLRVTIDRPEVLNALNATVLRELNQVIDEAIKAKKRILVLEGGGHKAFIAGADISEMKNLKPDEALQFARLGQELTLKLEQAPFISIAKVQGYALGGGCELAMACDLLIASETALFGQPEVSLGLIPGFGGTQRLVKRVGSPLAFAILVGGRKLTGREALLYGLASDAVTKEELETRVQETIDVLLRSGPQAIRETKRLIHNAFEMPLFHGLDAEATSFANCFARKESQEGILAFLEKRKAEFSE